MRYILPEEATDWKLVEVMDSAGRRPCSDKYASANVADLVEVFSALRILRTAGCTPDRLKGSPILELWKQACPNAHRKTEVWILKAKPSGWRLYFRKSTTAPRQLEFMYAVNKKKSRRDPEDFARCCRIIEGLEAGRLQLVPLDIPRR